MSIFGRVADFGVIPVITIDDPENAEGLADALINGGLPIAEVTFRTPAAGKAIERMAARRPDMLVGAGTIIFADLVHQCIDVGAKFTLAPGVDPRVVETCKQVRMPHVPGVSSATDIQIAVSLGCAFLKFFPAESAGGVKLLKDISAPFAHLGLGFNPTGGITEANLSAWLKHPGVRAVGGSWIATREDIANRNWSKITASAAHAIACVREIRGEAVNV